MAVRPRVGRPPLLAGTVTEPASTSLPKPMYDQLCAIALREQADMAKVLRHAAERLLEEERRHPIRL